MTTGAAAWRIFGKRAPKVSRNCSKRTPTRASADWPTSPTSSKCAVYIRIHFDAAAPGAGARAMTAVISDTIAAILANRPRVFVRSISWILLSLHDERPLHATRAKTSSHL